MKLLLPLLILFFGCNKPSSLSGNWLLNIELQKEKNLEVLIHLDEKKNKLSGWLQNSDEKVRLEGDRDGDKFELEIGAHYAIFKGKIKENKLEGKWVRTNKENYQVPFSAIKTSKEHLYKSYEEQTNMNSFRGKWKVDFGDDKYGLGLFEQIGSRVKGSILTETGDYRFLDGYISENNVYLYGFDGVFSFVFEFIINQDKLVGKMFAGNSTQKDLSASRDDSYELKDPNELTKLLDQSPLKLSAKTVEGDEFNLQNLNDKAKVIQIFGSWCPNCIDETNYFLNWRKNNPAMSDKVEFVAYSFEKTKTKNEAIKNLKKFKAKMKMDYSMILADFDGSVKPTDIFPIDKTIAFPTTLFLDKENKIRKIHTGFSGQATGSAFEKFKEEFNSLVLSLVKE